MAPQRQVPLPLPPLPTHTAHLLSLLFGLCYVGSLYISKHARLSFSKKATTNENDVPRDKEDNERWRDDPEVIRARLVAVSGATVLCCGMLLGVVWRLVGLERANLPLSLEQTRLYLGLTGFSLFLPHLTTPILFLGPLFAGYLGGQLPLQRNWVWENHVVRRFFSWQGIRNYGLAPVTEEIVFRACVLSAYHLSGASKVRMIFLGPLTFGLAHIHHAWDTYNRYGRTRSAAKRAVLMSLFQLGYTTLFGFHTSYLFLRTGSILPPISAHVFCNVMGVPELGWELRRFPNYRRAIIAAYVAGLAGFVYTLPRWTARASEGSLYWRSADALASF